MYYGKLPEGVTQAMDLKPGNVIDWGNNKGWTVDGIGYGYLRVRLEVHRDDTRETWDLGANERVRLVGTM